MIGPTVPTPRDPLGNEVVSISMLENRGNDEPSFYSQTNTDVPTERSKRLLHWPFTWMGLLAICWVVYELTHEPALGALAICIKFGWQDFITAYWLFVTDPYRYRGHATSWLYFGWGLWKMALVAFLMSMGFVLVAPQKFVNPPNKEVLVLLLTTFLTTLVGFFLATVATLIAVSMAWHGRFRLWLDRATHRARTQNYWPPAHLCLQRPNRLGELLYTAMGIVALVGLILFLSYFNSKLGPLVVVPILFTPVILCVARELIYQRVYARHPVECWDDDFWPEMVSAKVEE